MEVELVSAVPEAAPAAVAEPSVTEPTSEPVVPVATDATVVESPAAASAEPAPQLYSLPDGRQVDAAGLQREYENLLPEFTRKSQRLAEYERGNSSQPINNPQVPKWQDPNYVPQSWGELVEMGKQAALEELSATARAEQEKQNQVLAVVDQQLSSIKARDPKVNEDALFTHANKYGFTNLEAAYENMAEIRRVAQATEARVLKDVGARKVDPIAGGGTPSSAPNAAVNSGNISNFSSALDFLRNKQG